MIMKLMKKISAILLTLCLCIPCFSLVAHAADGKISFTDPETAVGEMVEVKCVLRSSGGSMGDIEVQLAFDSEYLSFQSGDGVEAADGSLTYKGDGGSSEISFTVKFQALKEGQTQITVNSASVASGSGDSLTLTEGKSTVKIAEGDPSKIVQTETTSTGAGDKEVEVNGEKYTLTDAFADADIPAGYSKTTVSLDGEDRQMVANESGAVTLGYLKDAEGTGDFFLYNTENATFSPYEEVSISDTTSIIVLSDTSNVKLPKQYKEAKLTLNEKEFPVWQDSSKEDTYVIYAMNNNGETGYYQYDPSENTYQRVEISSDDEDSSKKNTGILGKIQNFIEKHLALIVLVGGLGGIIILVVLIVLGVKLHNRNAELGELYDEYGIDEEEDEPEEPVKEKKGGLFGKRKKDEDEFEAYEESSFDEDDFEDDFEDDYEDEYEDDFEDDFGREERFDTVELSSFEADEDVFAGYDRRDELTIDDLDDLLGEQPKKRGHIEADDAFKVDFIDLD